MVNLATIKAEAEKKIALVENGTISIDDVFKAKSTTILTEVGYHNFKVSETETKENALIIKGQTVTDEGTPTDETIKTITLRVFADGEMFRKQYKDILEQLELPLSSNFSVLPQFINKTFVVKVVKNAKGYAQYYLNKDFIIASYLEEMNTANEN